GIIFVADSQEARMEANIEAMHNLYENLESYGYDISEIPLAIQYNKRDLENIQPVEELRAQLNPSDDPDFEAIAIQGEGVFDTLKSVSKRVVANLK
ncbi:MAG: gliding-motility protein MglA, partial [Longimicrobiales bacterium]|nr:gliding-motility protein MglA [Longimicrobiales bacterium]